MTDINSAARHAYIENTIEHTQTMLADSRVKCALGDRAVTLTEMANNFFVPNIRNGSPVIPDEYLDSNSYPIMALGPGDRFRLEFLMPTPRQAGIAKANFEEKASLFPADVIIDEIVRIAEAEAYQEIAYNSSRMGSCVTGDNQLECTAGIFGPAHPAVRDKRFVSFKTRPLVTIKYTDNMYRGFGRNIRPDLIVHELTHVRQSEDSSMEYAPERPKNAAARRELEAIHVGAIMMNAAVGGPLDPQDIAISGADKALQIEAIRKELANPNDPFAMPRRTIDALKAKGLYRHVVQADLLVA